MTNISALSRDILGYISKRIVLKTKKIYMFFNVFCAASNEPGFTALKQLWKFNQGAA